MVIRMPLFDKPHVNHEKHLCSMVASGATIDEYKNLVKDPKYLCRGCGRLANKSENLCDPVEI
jgi:hypothetical protein